MKKIILIIIFGLSIVGCTTNYNLIQKGKVIHYIDCTGVHTSINTCLARAKSICPQGFQVIRNSVVPDVAPRVYTPDDSNLPYIQRVPETVKGIAVVCQPS